MASYDTKSGLSGAGTGAMIGSVGGPIGMGIGALLGSGTGFFGGSKDKMKKLPTMTPQQESILNALLSKLEGSLGGSYEKGLSSLQELLDPSSSAYQRFTDPYMQQFEQQTVPSLAERFAGAGATGGALSSSGFGQALSSAGSQLQSQLAQLKSGLQQQAIRDILSQYQSILGVGLGSQPFAYTHKPGLSGLGENLLSGYMSSGFPGLRR